MAHTRVSQMSALVAPPEHFLAPLLALGIPRACFILSIAPLTPQTEVSMLVFCIREGVIAVTVYNIVMYLELSSHNI